MANQLAMDGYVVLPLHGQFSAAQSVEDFHATMTQFPEFRHSMTKYEARVLGGFAALGNPASFHNPYVRALRAQAYSTVRPVLAELARQRYPTHKFLEMVLDRMLYRVAGDKPTREAWHRDIAPQHQHQPLKVSRDSDYDDNDDMDAATQSPTVDSSHAAFNATLCPSCDIVFGGFINLGAQEQHFSCIPRSHVLNPCCLPSGFVKETINPHTKSRKQCITIPPGHVLLFNATLLHEVCARAYPHHLYRLFVCFKLKVHDTPDPFLAHVLESQGVPLLPSGQRVPMYARLHWTNHRGKLTEFSSKVIECMQEKRRLMSCTSPDQSDLGRVYRVVCQYMPSLKAVGLPLYPAYTPEETALLTPQPLGEVTP